MIFIALAALAIYIFNSCWQFHIQRKMCKAHHDHEECEKGYEVTRQQWLSIRESLEMSCTMLGKRALAAEAELDRMRAGGKPTAGTGETH